MTQTALNVLEETHALVPAPPEPSPNRRDRRPGASRGLVVTSEDAVPDRNWDAAVEAAGEDLVQTTAWATARQSVGMRVWHLRLRDGHGSLIGGCLMQLRRILPGVWIGAVPRGPVLFDGAEDAAGLLVAEMLAAARRLGVRLLVVQPPDSKASLLPAMIAVGFRPGGPSISPSATIRLDLSLSDDELIRRMNSNRRRILRSIPAGAFTTEQSDDVEAFHHLYVNSARRQGFIPITLANLRAQWENLAPRGLCQLFVTRFEGRPVAAEWFTSFGDTVTLKLRGFDTTITGTAARSAPTASVWHCLHRARNIGKRYFDFGGFDRARAELLMAGNKPAPEFTSTHSYFKWSFGGDLQLLPGPHFILPGAVNRRLFTYPAQRILTSSRIQELAQRVRAAK